MGLTVVYPCLSFLGKAREVSLFQVKAGPILCSDRKTEHAVTETTCTLRDCIWHHTLAELPRVFLTAQTISWEFSKAGLWTEASLSGPSMSMSPVFQATSQKAPLLLQNDLYGPTTLSPASPLPQPMDSFLSHTVLGIIKGSILVFIFVGWQKIFQKVPVGNYSALTISVQQSGCLQAWVIWPVAWEFMFPKSLKDSTATLS